ncbi:uncharacterized protein N7459_001670 [Penicillium hispanicum]|uniref:uncharacterized protein n=1 Tax=Penicillium hispanicum TaxID=1080232 RepID=UPI00253F6BB0|nr:uncharacterized protein N7459_001670 [Penicillium hispanicum]KAJ5595462.1 hypothetical protein N7459_001670 [Penicillium hispanicum]
MNVGAHFLWFCLLLLLPVASLAQLEARADIANSCKNIRSALKHAEPILPAMGKRGGEAVTWYLDNWNNDNLSNEDKVHRASIASALKTIFGWGVDPKLGAKTKYYKWVSRGLPSMSRFGFNGNCTEKIKILTSPSTKDQLWNIGDIRSNDVQIECSLSFLSATHDGKTSVSSNGAKQYWSDLHGAWTLNSPKMCDGNTVAILLNFETSPKEIIVLCPNSLKSMAQTSRRELNWEDYLTRGVDYSLNVYAGSLSSVLFDMLGRTIKGGKAMDREYRADDGTQTVTTDWAGLSQLASQSPDLTFSNAYSIMAFGLG